MELCIIKLDIYELGFEQCLEWVRDVANWLLLDLKFLMDLKTVNFQTLNCKWRAKNDLIGASCL